MTVEEISEAIKDARKSSKGWTQDELAVHAGMCRKTIEKLEAGDGNGRFIFYTWALEALGLELKVEVKEND